MMSIVDYALALVQVDAQCVEPSANSKLRSNTVSLRTTTLSTYHPPHFAFFTSRIATSENIYTVCRILPGYSWNMRIQHTFLFKKTSQEVKIQTRVSSLPFSLLYSY